MSDCDAKAINFKDVCPGCKKAVGRDRITSLQDNHGEYFKCLDCNEEFVRIPIKMNMQKGELFRIDSSREVDQHFLCKGRKVLFFSLKPKEFLWVERKKTVVGQFEL